MVAYLPLLGKLESYEDRPRPGGPVVGGAGVGAVAHRRRAAPGGSNHHKVVFKELLTQPSRTAAKVNGHEAPEHLLKAADLTEKEDLEVEVVGTRGGGTILDLFRPTKMALRTTNMCFQWFSATM